MRGRLARAVAPQAQLLAVTHHWDDYGRRRVQALLDGQWQPAQLWGGVKEGMVRVGEFGPRVPAAVRDEVLARQREIGAGRLRPFSGPLVDHTGQTEQPAAAPGPHTRCLTLAGVG